LFFPTLPFRHENLKIPGKAEFWNNSPTSKHRTLIPVFRIPVFSASFSIKKSEA
jgi:hypothetical protein